MPLPCPTLPQIDETYHAKNDAVKTVLLASSTKSHTVATPSVAIAAPPCVAKPARSPVSPSATGLMAAFRRLTMSSGDLIKASRKGKLNKAKRLIGDGAKLEEKDEVRQ